MMKGVLGAGSLLFALLFAVSTISKVDDWSGWEHSASLWLPTHAFRTGVLGIPAVEGVVVAVLLFRPHLGLVLASVLLIIFGLGVTALMPRARGASCGCFGPRHESVIGWALVAKDLALAAAALSLGLIARQPIDEGHSIPAVLGVLLAVPILLLVREARRGRAALQTT
jgi:hypothetical protein